MVRLWVCVFMLALTCCATKTPEQRAAIASAAARPVTCLTGPDCEVKWSRAIEWVSENSAYRFRTQTDQVIETAGPLPDSTSSAFLVTKLADGRGGYGIRFRSGCDNIFGCIPDATELRASFATYVMAQ